MRATGFGLVTAMFVLGAAPSILLASYMTLQQTVVIAAAISGMALLYAGASAWAVYACRCGMCCTCAMFAQ